MRCVLNPSRESIRAATVRERTSLVAYSVTIFEKFDLSGKTALVTGARRGLGMAMAVALAEAGADIVATSATLEPEGSAVARAVEARGRTSEERRLSKESEAR